MSKENPFLGRFKNEKILVPTVIIEFTKHKRDNPLAKRLSCKKRRKRHVNGFEIFISIKRKKDVIVVLGLAVKISGDCV